MKNLLSFAFSALIVTFSALYATAGIAAEKPVQHLKLADITSYDEAKKVFIETTSQIKSKTKLDAAELHEIHMITYSLEKAVAYFVENMKDEQKIAVKKIADVVELIHLGSENNRTVETKIYLEEYFKLAEAFAIKL